ncbi:hypothetical protein [Paenibacillus sp. TCA20]|uniref:hypothetical protein n=1 Tax=Paenibacillus sp. TCA20 TaxID=1499968 RepID=UPI001EE64F9C|nr:hypothetical protein [Paenibacillus sp. TCA20]
MMKRYQDRHRNVTKVPTSTPRTIGMDRPKGTIVHEGVRPQGRGTKKVNTCGWPEEDKAFRRFGWTMVGVGILVIISFIVQNLGE